VAKKVICRKHSSGGLPMSELVQVATSTGTRDVAERIAVELVDRRLAACVQVSGPIASTYRWQGAIENAEEWLCVAKSSRQQLAAIQEVLKRLHPYEVPELVATPIVGGSEAYLKWLVEQLTPDT
jgi:periplasmic divalent cation tolerance protein